MPGAPEMLAIEQQTSAPIKMKKIFHENLF
jgi:hypothetical protein